MPTDRLTKEQTIHGLAAYAARAKHFTPEECAEVESKAEYKPRKEPEAMR